MKIFLLDATAAFVDFAMRAEADGHEVKVWMPEHPKGGRWTVGDGLIDKVKDWKPWMKWADLILLSDNVKYMREIETYRKQGYPIFSSGLVGASWELERGTGQDLFKSYGIPVMESIIFSNYDEARDYVKATKGRYVSKPTGDADKALSYVSKGPEDLNFMLEYWKKSGKLKAEFLLQEFTPGIEMAVGAWVGKNGFLGYALENFEFKKLMPGDAGVNTGEMGTLMKYVSQEESLLFQKVLQPLEAELIRTGYTGFIDVAVIITEDGTPYPLEFTSRFGWPLFNIQQVLHPNIADWMFDALNGADTFKPSLEIAAGVVLGIPDFPYNKLSPEAVSGYPIWGPEKSPELRYFTHPCEVKLGEVECLDGGIWKKEPLFVSAGQYLMVMSATGLSVKEACSTVYERVKKLVICNSPIYRNDIGKRLEEQLKELKKLGYATTWRY